MPKRRANGEGSIYKRKDGTWAAQYTDFNGKKRYLYGKTQKIVKDKLDEAKKLKDQGIVLDGKNIKYSDWVKEWVEVYEKPVVRHTTYQLHERMVRKHIAPYFEGILLKDIRLTAVQKFLNHMSEHRTDGKPGGYAEQSIKVMKLCINASLEKAVDVGYIPSNPAMKARIAKTMRKPKEVFTPEEQTAFEKHVIDRMEIRRDDFIFVLVLHTGLRIGEALALRKDDIDLEKKELRVDKTLYRITTTGDDKKQSFRTIGEPKTTFSTRTVPLSGYICKLIAKYIEILDGEISANVERWKTKWYFEPRWVDEGYLFLSGFGNVYDHSLLTRRFRNLGKEVYINPKITLHGLRHTFCTRWLEKGLDVKTLSDIVGHTDSNLTLNTYSHSMPQQKRKSVELFAADMEHTEDEKQ